MWEVSAPRRRTTSVATTDTLPMPGRVYTIGTVQVNAAFDRLAALLPLAERQAGLDAHLRSVHREILRGFLENGAAPPVDPADAVPLAAADLIVTGADGVIIGAYPFTSEHTAHAVQSGTTHVHAMCSLDALAVAPMFGVTTRVISRCAVSGAAIDVHQRGDDLVSSHPPEPWIGIRWQEPCGHAATSLCREMVFLSDEHAALEWRGADPDSAGILPLPAAIELAAAFFNPLAG